MRPKTAVFGFFMESERKECNKKEAAQNPMPKSDFETAPPKISMV